MRRRHHHDYHHLPGHHRHLHGSHKATLSAGLSTKGAIRHRHHTGRHALAYAAAETPVADMTAGAFSHMHMRSNGLQPVPYALNTDMNKFKGSIAAEESAGHQYGYINYNAVGPIIHHRTVTYDKNHHKHIHDQTDRAHGGYQVMGQNIRNWWHMSPEAFRRNPVLQENLVTARFGQQRALGKDWNTMAHDWIGHGVRDMGTGRLSSEYAATVSGRMGSPGNGNRHPVAPMQGPATAEATGFFAWLTGSDSAPVQNPGALRADNSASAARSEEHRSHRHHNAHVAVKDQTHAHDTTIAARATSRRSTPKLG